LDILGILLLPHVVVVIAIWVVMAALLPKRRARARAKAVADQTPPLTELASKLGGSLSVPGEAWTPRLQRSKPQADLTLEFRRGPWPVRVTEACNPKPLFSGNLIEHEHWIEIATIPLPTRKMRFEFFSLSFEDGVVHAVCQGPIQPDELVFLVDLIVETLDRIPGVEPRDPATTA
jgi:hypothetical protein